MWTQEGADLEGPLVSWLRCVSAQIVFSFDSCLRILTSKKEGAVLATSVEVLGVDLRTRARQLRAKEKSTRKKCGVRISLIRRNRISIKVREHG